jgi:tetratricopeptide (TPR) repeat protein
MRKSIGFFMLLWMLSYYLAAQQAILRGIITYQNSGKPVGGVNVSAFGATDTSTDSSGRFELKFANKKPGDMVDIIADKKGLEVVYKKGLRTAIRTNPDEPVRIVMRPEGEGERLKKQYAEIASKAIQETYEKLLAKKDKTIAELTRQRDAALAQVPKLSATFADVDLARASELYKKAFAFYKHGKIDKAIAVLDDAKIDKAAREAREEERIAREAEIKARERKLKAREAIRKSADNFMLKAQLLVIQLQFKEAEKYFQKAIDIDPENIGNIGTAAHYLYKQTQFEKSLRLYEKALSLSRNEIERAASLNNLGVLYSDTSRFKDAESAYQEALNSYRELAKKNKAAYLPYVAGTSNNLGNLYYKTSRFKDAESAYQEALNSYRELAKKNKAAYLPDVAMTLNNLGTLYSDTSRFKDAESAYQEALNSYRELAKKNKAAYLPYVATSLNNLGLFYWQTEKLPDALKALDEAKEIREMLAQKNPSAYEIDLCQTLIPLSIISIISADETSLPSTIGKGRQYLDRAISILEKYPHVPAAQNMLKLAKKLKSELK